MTTPSITLSDDEDTFISDADSLSEDDDMHDLDDEQDDDDSVSDGGSISDSGFSPISAADKGKGKRGAGAGGDGSSYGVDYKVHSAQELRDEQSKAIASVKDMLGLKVRSLLRARRVICSSLIRGGGRGGGASALPGRETRIDSPQKQEGYLFESETAVLLRFFGWKQEKLIEKYMDNPEKTLATAGVHEGGTQPRLKRVRGFVCDVCYDSDGTSETLALSCDMRSNRSVCKDCYSQYVTSKIMDESESRRIQCMGSKCNVIVDEKTVELLVEPAVLARYDLLTKLPFAPHSDLLALTYAATAPS
ncbi:hypothetical protein P7C70_g3078, partial [Phenoliferia sp. Uapishka_3]